MTLLLLSVLALGILLAADVFYDAKNNLQQSIIFYYVDLFFGVLERVVDFIHNLHMLFWNWLQINMSGLIVCLHLQYLYYELSKIYKRHRRYREVAEILSTKIPLAYIQDNCAVCWDVLSPGRQLRCGHVFHDACLRSWIEYMPTCPTCRANIPELAPLRDDTMQETESGAALSPSAVSPEGHVPLPFLPSSEQQGQLQSAQPTVTANSSSAADVSEYAVSPPLSALSTTDATSASRSHESGSGLSGVVAQLADELSLAFAALNNRSCVEASVMQHISTTVIVNNLVDARRDLLPLRSLRTSDLPVKFLGELEAELMTYLMPSKSADNGTSNNESSSLPNQSSEPPGPSASCPNKPSPSVGTPAMPEITLSLTSSSSESCEDSSEEEFSPRKIVRQAIRVLLVRAGQAAEAAHRLRSMNRRRRRRKTSVCSAQSQPCKELPKGDLNTLSPPVHGEPLTHSENISAITATVSCLSSQEVDVGPTSLPPTDSNQPKIRSAKTLARNQCSSTETQKERMNQLLSSARRRFLKKSFHQS
nr:unnamed protein product [Spirometra erinaceieuropaei]